MLQWIQAEPARSAGSIITKCEGCKTVAELMECYTYQRRNNTHKNTQQIGKIKAVNNALQGTYTAHLNIKDLIV